MTRIITIVTAALVSLTVVPAVALQNAVQHDSSAIPRITLANFKPLQASGKVLVLDVREPHAFEAGRIPGALNVPLGAVPERAAEIRKKAAGRPVIAYCTCQGEHTAAEALLILYKLGVTDVHALVGGYNAWVMDGGRVER